MSQFNPWQYAAQYFPWVHIDTYADLPRGLIGQTDGVTIWLSRRLTQAARRCTLTHELVHIERGPTPDIEWFAHRDHHIVDATSARRLIDLDEFIDVVATHDGRIDVSVADDLWVDYPTLCDFVASLSDVERAQVDTELMRRTA